MAQPYLTIGAVVLDPLDPATLPNNAVYVDQSSGALSNKATTGSTSAIGQGSASTDSLFTKVMHNLSGVTIAANMPVAKKTDGSIISAAAGITGDMVLIGVAQAAIQNNSQGNVITIGPNVLGALIGSSYTFYPGQAVYLNDQGGYTGDLTSLSISTDALFRIGYADCAAGVASTTAVDLIMFAESVSSI